MIRRIGLDRLLNRRHGGAGRSPRNESVGGVFIIIFESSKPSQHSSSSFAARKKTQVASDDSEDVDCEFVEESPKKKIQNKKRKPLAYLSNHNQRDVRDFSRACVIPCLVPCL